MHTFIDILCEIRKTLLTNKLRTFLSMLGIIIGVTSVITIMAIGEGSKRSIESMLSGIGNNIIFVSKGYDSNSKFDSFNYNIEDGKYLEESAPDISKLAPVYYLNSGIKIKKKIFPINAICTNGKYFDIVNVKLKKGTGFKEQDNIDKNNVAVIGSTVAEKLFPKEEPIGKEFYLIVNNFGEIKKYPSV